MSDLIERQAAIDAVINLWADKPFGNPALVEIKDCIEALPSVQPEVTEEAVKEYCHKRCLCIVDSALIKKYASAQPERKKEKWILVKGSNGKDYHKCSECLHTQDITGVKNYCAVCGAEMEGEA